MFKNILQHSVFTHKLCFHPDRRQRAFSHMKLIFTNLIYMTSLNVKFMNTQHLVLVFVISKCKPFVHEKEQLKEE